MAASADSALQAFAAQQPRLWTELLGPGTDCAERLRSLAMSADSTVRMRVMAMFIGVAAGSSDLARELTASGIVDLLFQELGEGNSIQCTQNGWFHPIAGVAGAVALANISCCNLQYETLALPPLPPPRNIADVIRLR